MLCESCHKNQITIEDLKRRLSDARYRYKVLEYQIANPPKPMVPGVCDGDHGIINSCPICKA